MNDRVSAMPYRHHSLAFGYRFDATRCVFIPATKELTAFERGIDDTDADPWRGAGYSTPYVPANSTNVTNAYKGGAFSVEHPTQILGVALVPDRIVRIVPPRDVRFAGEPFKTPAFPRDGGEVLTDNAEVAELHGFLFDSLLHGGEAELLPSGGGGSCSLYCGPMRFLRSDDGTFAWRPAQAVFCEPNDRNMGGFTPNRMRFTFRESVGAVRLVEGVAAPADGDYAVVEFDVRVEVARVKVSEESRRSATYEGVEEIDRCKIAAWRESVSQVRHADRHIVASPAVEYNQSFAQHGYIGWRSK